MARMIYKRDSTAVHLKMGRRHIRLCGRKSGTGKWTTAMQVALDKLKEKEREKNIVADARDDAYDDVRLCDVELDNAVRTAYERARQYDRENMARTLDILFPSRGFSTIVNMPLSKEPAEVNKLILKLESLEENHPLRDLVNPLKNKVEASGNAWENYQKAIFNLQEMLVSEELAKMAVRQQYEYNWLDARKEFGATVAETLFPKVSAKSSPKQDNGEEQEEDDAGDE